MVNVGIAYVEYLASCVQVRGVCFTSPNEVTFSLEWLWLITIKLEHRLGPTERWQKIGSWTYQLCHRNAWDSGQRAPPKCAEGNRARAKQSLTLYKVARLL